MFDVFAKLVGNSADNRIEKFESVMLHLSGMRGSTDYELTVKTDSESQQAVLSQYSYHYRSGEEQRELERTTRLAVQDAIKKLNECHLANWNGFHGKHPHNVSDGVMFRMEAIINDEQTIFADGSANFPNGYHELVRWFGEQLSQTA